jgi:polyhydroxybutyrate depolymerase
VSGFSSGGMMALRLICEAPELIAAAAPIAASFPVELARTCKAPRPTPVLVINGTADPVLPYHGGAVILGGGKVLSTDETMRFLRTVNGCTDGASVRQLPNTDGDSGSTVSISSWTNCASAAPVMLYRIEGGGHRIPSRREEWPVADMVLGKMNHDFETAQAIWSFFQDKKR